MGGKRAGDRVNIEADVLARYVYAAVTKSPDAERDKESLLTKMERVGF
jgi:riboflavin synthase alpha subunit